MGRDGACGCGSGWGGQRLLEAARRSGARGREGRGRGRVSCAAPAGRRRVSGAVGPGDERAGVFRGAVADGSYWAPDVARRRLGTERGSLSGASPLCLWTAKAGGLGCGAKVEKPETGEGKKNVFHTFIRRWVEECAARSAGTGI